MFRVASLAAVLTVLIPLPGHTQGGRRPARTARPAHAPAAAAPVVDTVTFSQLRYRYIGPVGNRVAAVAGVAGDASTYYAGAASGGIWKTTDGGIHWQPIFDDQPVQSIGALAVAPSDENVVWAGTGEAWISSHISIGNGIYKSTDAGKTWQHLGLDLTGRIGRVVIHPTNPDIVYAAALGHSYGPQQERGVYRTMDGGKTWERVLFVDENTGAADVVMDPNNPRILFAAMWQLVIHTWGRESGGPGSGIYVSKDGGTTWKKLTGNGLPAKPFGKVGLAISRSNSSRIYALIETGDGVPVHCQDTERGERWRSDGGGENWRVVSYDRQLSCRQPYYTRVAVAPDRDNEAYFLCAAFSKTLDGGETTTNVPFPQSPGGDNHDMWIDPTDGNRLVVGVRLGERGRDRGALRRAHAAGAERGDMAAEHDRFPGGGREVPLRVDHAADDLTARSQPHLRRQPVRPHDDRRRQELAGDQPRSDAQRQEQAADLGRAHSGQHRRRVRRRGVRDRGVAAEGGFDLGGHERWPGAAHPRRREELDERHGQHSGHASVGHGLEHRTVALRHRHCVPHGGCAAGQQPRPVRLQDDRLRAQLATHRERRRQRAGELRARGPGGPGASRTALPRYRERAVRVVRRRRELAAAADQSPARARVLAGDPGSLQRPRGLDVRARLLDPRRPDTVAAAHRGRSWSDGRAVQAARRVPVPLDHVAERDD